MKKKPNKTNTKQKNQGNKKIQEHHEVMLNFCFKQLTLGKFTMKVKVTLQYDTVTSKVTLTIIGKYIQTEVGHDPNILHTDKNKQIMKRN